MKAAILAGALALAGFERAASEGPAEALTRGKLAADLGQHAAAAAAFSAVRDDPRVSAAERGEALVRLATARRELGDEQGSVDAFEQAWRQHGQDPDVLRLLLRAVGSGLPGRERWEEVWPRVSIEFDRTVPARPQVRVEWPGVTPSLCPCSGHPVSIDLVDLSLRSVFRLIADVSGKSVVVGPGVQGSITMHAENRPWDEVLERVLAPNGYVAQHDGKVVRITLPGDTAPDAPARRRFTGKPVSLDYKGADLVDVLRELAAHGGATVEFPEGLGGRATLKLVDVPWDQAFDLAAWTNGLTWTRSGDLIRVASKGSDPAR